MTALSHVPAPGAAPLGRMLLAQTAMELRLTLRRGESLLLTMVIPVALLLFFATVDLVDTGRGQDVDFLVPGVLALAVMSTAMTGLAIATGFERQYGVLKRLGASPLSRSALLGAKTLSVLAIEALQCAVIVTTGLVLGWRPHDLAGAGAAALLLVLGTACFSGLGLLMAGTLRAEATLAAANGLYLLLLLVGGVLVPLERLPEAIRSVARLTPTSALSDGLRDTLGAGVGLSARPLLVLGVWAAASLGAAAATFRWE